MGKEVCKVENLGRFVDKRAKGFNSKECDGPTSLVYIQIACTLTED